MMASEETTMGASSPTDTGHEPAGEELPAREFQHIVIALLFGVLTTMAAGIAFLITIAEPPTLFLGSIVLALMGLAVGSAAGMLHALYHLLCWHFSRDTESDLP